MAFNSPEQLNPDPGCGEKLLTFYDEGKDTVFSYSRPQPVYT